MASEVKSTTTFWSELPIQNRQSQLVCARARDVLMNIQTGLRLLKNQKDYRQPSPHLSEMGEGAV